MKLHFIKLFFIFILSIAITSCLKDKAFDKGETQSVQGSSIKAIGIGLTVSDPSNFLVISFNSSANDTTINLIPVTLGSSPATEDIHITLIPDSTLINDYNDSNATAYQIPTSFSLLDNGVVTIPKGSTVGYLKIKFKPNDFIGADYALGYRISKIDESGYTIANLNKGIVAVGIKNKFDGVYGLTINTSGWAAYGISDGVSNVWPSNVSLITAGALSVTLKTTETGFGQNAFTDAGGLTSFGATKPLYTFDVNNNLVNVSNLKPNDGRNRAFRLNPSVTDSRFDVATKSIYAAYIMSQNGRPDQKIYDTLNYVGPR